MRIAALFLAVLDRFATDEIGSRVTKRKPLKINIFDSEAT